jgi:adenine-specific DNA-methyltransferase
VLYVADETASLIERGTINVVSRDANGVANLGFAETPRVSIKTVWNRGRHNAGVYGSHLLTAFIGERGAFTFPKSLYAVKDTLAALTYDKRDALVLDFFAGSGTTLHAALLLNAEDGGTRRCILVTNNELKHTVSARLHRKGLFRGDDEFEASGVFEAVTRPRVTAAVTGRRADGKPVEGAYLGLAREYAEGFAENVEFFRLGYTEAPEIEFGLRFAEIHPLLWLRAGGIGERKVIDPAGPLYLPAHSPYAVLFDPSGVPTLLASLPSRPDITHVFIVADSQESFAHLADDIPQRIEKVRLYSEYLETMRGATQWI